MNCESFQNALYEYVDGSLAPERRTAAERHLAECDACRRLLQQELRMAQTLARGFRHNTGHLALAPEFQERLLTALQNQAETKITPLPEPRDTGSLRLLWPSALAACVLITCFRLCHLFSGMHAPAAAPGQATASRTPPDISLHYAYCVPTYIFHQEGNQVVDVLTCEPRTVDITFRRNSRPNPL